MHCCLQAPESLEVCSLCSRPTLQVDLTIQGYTGNALSLKIIISVLLGLSLYNAVELIILVLVTFQRYHGLYFWSLLIAGFGVLPYSLGFVIKFFQLLDPNSDPGYVAVVLLTVGWWTMVSGIYDPSLGLSTLTLYQVNRWCFGLAYIFSPTHEGSFGGHST